MELLERGEQEQHIARHGGQRCRHKLGGRGRGRQIGSNTARIDEDRHPWAVASHWLACVDTVPRVRPLNHVVGEKGEKGASR